MNKDEAEEITTLIGVVNTLEERVNQLREVRNSSNEIRSRLEITPSNNNSKPLDKCEPISIIERLLEVSDDLDILTSDIRENNNISLKAIG